MFPLVRCALLPLVDPAESFRSRVLSFFTWLDLGSGSAFRSSRRKSSPDVSDFCSHGFSSCFLGVLGPLGAVGKTTLWTFSNPGGAFGVHFCCAPSLCRFPLVPILSRPFGVPPQYLVPFHSP